MTTFASFGLPETLLKALEKINFTTPTPIQAQAVPVALKGRDLLGTAATGTGKTAAFALPMLAHLLKNPDSIALIMTPTRELAMQVKATIEPLMVYHRNIGTACLIGGDFIQKQHQHLKRHPRLIIGTPGRINDHLARGWLNLSRADFLVLDETDRMLDMGFGVQIEKIIDKMARRRQTLMFSATLPKQIVKMADQYLDNPERITVGVVNKVAAKIKQELLHVNDADKLGVLFEQLDARQGSVIIFVKTKYGTEKLAKKLGQGGHEAEAIHGDLRQNKRNRVIQDFRDMKYRILVATDVAARGLDIPHIEHVINYDLPQAPEDYIHRVGRTARAGAEGEAVNLITPADTAKWKAIHKLMNPDEKPQHKDARRDKAEADSARKQAQGRKSPFGRKAGGDRRFDEGSRFNDRRQKDKPRGTRAYAKQKREGLQGAGRDDTRHFQRDDARNYKSDDARNYKRDDARSFKRDDDRRFQRDDRPRRDDRAASYGARDDRGGKKGPRGGKPQQDGGRKAYNRSPFGENRAKPGNGGGFKKRSRAA